MEYIVATVFNAYQAMQDVQQRKELWELLESSKPVLGSWKDIGAYIETLSLPIGSMSLR
jgi:hypothetical protein